MWSVVNLVLATAANETFATGGAVALLSASRAFPEADRLFIDCGMEAVTRERIERAFEARGLSLRIEKPIHDLGQVRTADLTHSSAYGRLSAPLIAHETGAERTLYLDADTMTFGSVEELAGRPFGGKPVAAVWDSRIARPDYFNSGVMLIHNRLWTQGEFSRKAIDRAAGLDASAFPEQDALNDVLKGRWTELSDNWNWEVPRSRSVRIGRWTLNRHGIEQPPANGILHFLGSVKPWEPSYPPTAYRRMWGRLAAMAA